MFETENYTKCVLYRRVSDPKQIKFGNGLKGQKQNSLAYIKANGWELEKTFTEKGLTAGNDFRNRPEILSLLKYLDDHSKTNYIVVVDDISRWARHTKFHLELREELRKRKAFLASPSLPFILDDSPESRYFETCLAAQAQCELERNKRRSHTRMRARLEMGYWTFPAPVGYSFKTIRNDGRCLFPNEDAKIIKQALERYADGRLLLKTDVLNFLIEKGFSGGVAKISTVTRILKNVMYTGYIEYPKWKISLRRGNHKALVTMSTYQKIQRKLEQKSSGYRKTDDDNFPLRRKFNCAICGKTMVGSFFKGKTKKHPFYTCRNSQCTAKPKYIKKAVLEAEYENLLEKVRPTNQLLKAFELEARRQWKEFNADHERLATRKKKELAKLNGQIDQVVDKIVSTTNKSLQTKLELRLCELENQVALL